MVILPSGVFQMGSPGSELDRHDDESPLTRISLQSFAIGQTEVTRAEWLEFERESGYRASSGCLVWDGDGYVRAAHLGWRYPGFEQSDQHPVTCVSWLDARAYADWLSKKTGHKYRLPLEKEWEYAARAGSQSPFHWAVAAAGMCSYANVADAALLQKQPRWSAEKCKDGYPYTAPVGSFIPNAWGLFDMHGNVMEWVQDCWGPQISADGSGTTPLNCRSRVTRGGGWDLIAPYSRSAYRGKAPEANRGTGTGFRLVREVP